MNRRTEMEPPMLNPVTERRIVVVLVVIATFAALALLFSGDPVYPVG